MKRGAAAAGVLWLAVVGLILLASCASAQLPRPVIVEERVVSEDADAGMRLIARILADACTSEATDEILVEHTVLLLKGCKSGPSVCLRLACKHLDRDSADEGLRRVVVR